MELLNVKGDLGETHLRIPPGTSKEEWSKIATQVAQVGAGFQWWVGDLAQYARHNFKEGDIESSWNELASATGMTRKRINMLADLSKKFAIKDRVKGLTATHHIQVMNLSLPERKKLLTRALAKHISAQELQQMAIDKHLRMLSIVIRVPYRYKDNKRFMLDLRDFVDTWKVKYYLPGTVKPHHKVAPKRVGLLPTVREAQA